MVAAAEDSRSRVYHFVARRAHGAPADPGRRRRHRPGRPAASARAHRGAGRSARRRGSRVSHTATTTVATQLPTTLTQVRPMSIRASIPSRSATPSAGRWNAVERAGEHDQRGARHAGDALARQHEHAASRRAARPTLIVDAGGLGHEHHRERQVQRRAVEVERVAGRHHEAHDPARHAELLEHLHRARQRGVRRRGGERDDRRLADRRAGRSACGRGSAASSPRTAR